MWDPDRLLVMFETNLMLIDLTKVRPGGIHINQV